MDAHVSLRRSAEGLRHALYALRTVKQDVDGRGRPLPRPAAELRSAATVGICIAEAALANETSVGCHYRLDVSTSEVVTADG